jgi:hypothetical protein
MWGGSFNENRQGKPKYWEKPVAVSLCSPQIPYGLTWDRNRAAAVGSRGLAHEAEQETRKQNKYACHLLSGHGEDGGDMFIRNVG